MFKNSVGVARTGTYSNCRISQQFYFWQIVLYPVWVACWSFMVMWPLCFCTVSTQQCLCMAVSIEMQKCCVNQLCCAWGKLACCWLWCTVLCEVVKSNTTDIDFSSSLTMRQICQATLNKLNKKQVFYSIKLALDILHCRALIETVFSL